MLEYHGPRPLEEQLLRDGVQIVQFGTASCMPCAALRQRISQWQDAHSDTAALYVSVEQYPQLAAQLGIFAAPTVLVYAGGQLALRESGYFSLDLLLQKAERYLSLLCPDSAAQV